MSETRPLAEVPTGELGPAWEARTAADPTVPADRWLAEADALRAAPGSSKRRALSCYRALRERLDPSVAADAERLRWVLENDPARDAAVEAIAARVAGASPDPDLRRTGELVLGQAAADAGRGDEAERRLRALLAAERGSGSRFERQALLSLARLWAHRRRGFEALVAARAAAALARKAGHAWDLCVARSRACMALEVVDDRARLAAAVEELDRSLDEVPAERARPLRYLVAAYRAELAAEGADPAALRAAVAALRDLHDAGPPGLEERFLLCLEARAAIRSGDAAGARRKLEEARAAPGTSPLSGLPVALLSMEIAEAFDGHAVAADAARDLRTLVEAAKAAGVAGPGTVLRFSEAAAGTLDRAGEVAGARAALDAAAAAALERIAEVERALVEVPELGATAPEDLRTLTESRDRFLRSHGALLARLAERMRADPPPELLPPTDGAGGAPAAAMLHACAWCRRLRGRSGEWLPVGEYLPDPSPLRVSHGICPDCHRRWMDRMRGGAGAAGS